MQELCQEKPRRDSSRIRADTCRRSAPRWTICLLLFVTHLCKRDAQRLTAAQTTRTTRSFIRQIRPHEGRRLLRVIPPSILDNTYCCEHSYSVAVLANLAQTPLICHILIDCSLIHREDVDSVLHSVQTAVGDIRKATFLLYFQAKFIGFTSTTARSVYFFLTVPPTYEYWRLSSRRPYRFWLSRQGSSPQKKCCVEHNNFHWPKSLHSSIFGSGKYDSHA